jgi:hypothetical protein
MKLLMAAFAALFAFTGLAAAADLGGSTKDTPGVYSKGHDPFSGLYAAGFIGGEMVDATISGTGIGFGPKGIFGGARLGYDQRLPGSNFVLGAFVEGDVSRVTSNVGPAASVDQTGDFLGGIKIGHVVGTSTEFYVNGAYVQTTQSVSGMSWSNPHGARVGLGVEEQLGSGWGLILEGGWTGFGDVSAAGATIKQEREDVRLGLLKRF